MIGSNYDEDNNDVVTAAVAAVVVVAVVAVDEGNQSWRARGDRTRVPVGRVAGLQGA